MNVTEFLLNNRDQSIVIEDSASEEDDVVLPQEPSAGAATSSAVVTNISHEMVDTSLLWCGSVNTSSVGSTTADNGATGCHDERSPTRRPTISPSPSSPTNATTTTTTTTTTTPSRTSSPRPPPSSSRSQTPRRATRPTSANSPSALPPSSHRSGGSGGALPSSRRSTSPLETTRTALDLLKFKASCRLSQLEKALSPQQADPERNKRTRMYTDGGSSISSFSTTSVSTRSQHRHRRRHARKRTKSSPLGKGDDDEDAEDADNEDAWDDEQQDRALSPPTMEQGDASQLPVFPSKRDDAGDHKSMPILQEVIKDDLTLVMKSSTVSDSGTAEQGPTMTPSFPFGSSVRKSSNKERALQALTKDDELIRPNSTGTAATTSTSTTTQHDQTKFEEEFDLWIDENDDSIEPTDERMSTTLWREFVQAGRISSFRVIGLAEKKAPPASDVSSRSIVPHANPSLDGQPMDHQKVRENALALLAACSTPKDASFDTDPNSSVNDYDNPSDGGSERDEERGEIIVPTESTNTPKSSNRLGCLMCFLCLALVSNVAVLSYWFFNDKFTEYLPFLSTSDQETSSLGSLEEEPKTSEPSPVHQTNSTKPPSTSGGLVIDDAPTSPPLPIIHPILEITDLPVKTRQALLIEGSPQARAMEWVESTTSSNGFERISLERQKQRFALATLYYSTATNPATRNSQGTKSLWKNHSGWLDPAVHECHWFTSMMIGNFESYRNPFGPICSPQEQYQRLIMTGNGLQGTLPEDLGFLLPHLIEIRLNGNSLTGSIPYFGESVIDLDLSLNQLTGNMSQVGYSSGLETLSLAGNQLTGNLGVLLESNRLTELKELNLQDNPQLTGSLPTQLGQLQQLQQLKLFRCKGLDGAIPTELGLCTHLRQLSLQESHGIEGSLPTEIGLCSELEGLYVYATKLTGSIPRQLGQLTRLIHLDISVNQFDSNLPTELGRLSRLEELWAYDNLFTGSIPSQLGLLTRLESLDLSSNALQGSLPTQLGQATNIVGFWAYHNEISGSIPTELGRWFDLVQLSLFHNELQHSIPSEIGQWRVLQGLWLDENQLTGPLPSTAFASLTNLAFLHLYGNQLTSTLPTELGLLTSLEELRLEQNQFNGTISADLGQIGKDLRWLLLHSNLLSGSIPSQLADLSGLMTVMLGGNDLSGTVPEEVCELKTTSKGFQSLSVDCQDVGCNCSCICT